MDRKTDSRKFYGYKKKNYAFKKRYPAKASTYRKKAAGARKRAPLKRKRASFNPVNTLISKEAVSFLQAQYNPWGKFTSPPYVPDLITIPSQKISFIIKGAFKVGSNGLGWVSLNPYSPAGMAAPNASNPYYISPIFSTLATSNATTIDLTEVTSRDWTGGPPSNVYLLPQFWQQQNFGGTAMDNILLGTSDDLDWRVVGAGIKVKYASAVQDRSGTYALYEAPANDAFLTEQARSFYEIANLRSSTRTAVTEDEVAVTWKPRGVGDLEYASDWLPDAVQLPGGVEHNNGLEKYHVLCVAVLGTSGHTYEFEAVVHYELVGLLANGQTASKCDLVGLGKVQSVITANPSANMTPVQTAYQKLAEASMSGTNNTSVKNIIPSKSTASQIFDAARIGNRFYQNVKPLWALGGAVLGGAAQIYRDYSYAAANLQNVGLDPILEHLDDLNGDGVLDMLRQFYNQA